ncbi:hypothetical protein N5T82_04815 [Aliarcobacter cryaerophilus]|uniref:hypothetical protein n=1 Tax=Aliarcobacter cryaerophilus TaxID=28198 RepID=UPI0021B576FF|nr:hypothetical protein [Aliarcobacter cryaerophilus]MCT7539166.1 hypothetical protein [Aliarcobacter cryaerophilus]
MEKRTNIGYLLFFILLILSLLEYISYSFFLMIIMIYISINIMINSLDKNDTSNNKDRVLILGILSILFSYSHYNYQIENDRRIKQAMNECYKLSSDSYLCDSIHSILEPEPPEIE